MTAMTASEVLRSVPITSMSKAELLALNTAIVGQIRNLQAIDAVRAGMTLKVGGHATFYSPKRGRTIKVRIDKVNVKTASCTELGYDNEPTFHKWKVATQLLTAC